MSHQEARAQTRRRITPEVFDSLGCRFYSAGNLEANLSSSSARIMSEFTNPNLEPLFTAEQIQTRIAELGAEIASDYAGRNPLLVGILKGAVVFISDLMRAIDLRLGMEFMAISSYGSSTRTSGEVKIVKDLDVAVEGRDILVVEDIVDTGLTLSYLLPNLYARGAQSVKLAALLDKWERREREVKIDYLGFKIPDAFVVGYGLDFAERYRNLPYIAVLKDPDA
jgi:hypoxanthine phosphoribosyltransferase